MQDMKNPRTTKADLKAASMPIVASDDYPYGLRLNIAKPQIDRLNELKGVKVGDKVIVLAVASVTRVESVQREDHDDYEVSLQIERMECRAKSKAMSEMDFNKLPDREKERLWKTAVKESGGKD